MAAISALCSSLLGVVVRLAPDSSRTLLPKTAKRRGGVKHPRRVRRSAPSDTATDLVVWPVGPAATGCIATDSARIGRIVHDQAHANRRYRRERRQERRCE